MTRQIPEIKLEAMEEADDSTTYAPVTDETIGLKVSAGKPNWRVRLSTVDLFVRTSLDQLLDIANIICFFY